MMMMMIVFRQTTGKLKQSEKLNKYLDLVRMDKKCKRVEILETIAKNLKKRQGKLNCDHLDHST